MFSHKFNRSYLHAVQNVCQVRLLTEMTLYNDYREAYPNVHYHSVCYVPSLMETKACTFRIQLHSWVDTRAQVNQFSN